MKFIYQEHSLKPGIYKIINTHTNRVYIGQAKRFKERWNGHRTSLVGKRHRNKFIQSDFDKCLTLLGHDDFLEFHVLEVMEGSSKEERNKREEEHIREVKQLGNCYNLLNGTTQSVHVFKDLEGFSAQVSEKMKLKWQEDTYVQAMMEARFQSKMYETVSEKAKLRWADNAFKTLVKFSMFTETVKLKRLQHSAKLASKFSKTYGTVISPDGKYMTVVNLNQFCRVNNLSRSAMQQLFKKRTKQHKGWQLA